MAIGFYFSGAAGSLQLPVNPEKLEVQYQGNNMRMSVESVTPRREAGDHDSIFCALSLLQYRSYGAQVLSMPTTDSGAVQAAPPSRETDKPVNATHTVASGESFWAIAQKELGDGSRYNEIAELNGMTAASVIHPGDVLKLPER